MKKARVYFSIIISTIALILAVTDWLKLRPQKKIEAKQAVRNPNGNIDSLAKAREAKAEKAKAIEMLDHFVDLEELTNEKKEL